MKLKVKESHSILNSHLWLDKRNQIIDAEPSVIISTTKFEPRDFEQIEEGNHLFHS